MGSYRYETAYVSAHTVNLLSESGMMSHMLHNGGDIVLFQNSLGQAISLHFIESALPLYEIRNILADNGRKDIYTLFLLWSDMLLPHHGQTYLVDDWMEALYTLYGSAIYAYELIDAESFVFPVYFRGHGQLRQVEHGTTVRYRLLSCRTVRTHLPDFNDVWKVADFGGSSGAAHDPVGEAAYDTALSEHYVLLGVTPSDDRETIKRAYRLLARRFHPDLNRDSTAHEQMQKLNEAYRAVLDTFGDETQGE